MQPGDLQHLQARKTTKSTKSRTKNSIPGVWKGGSLRQILKTKLLTVRCVPISKLSLRISVMRMQIGQSWPNQLWNQIARFLFRRLRDAQCIGHHGLKSVAQSELNTTPWVVHRCCCKQEFQITNYLLVCSATLVPDPPFSSKTRVCNSTGRKQLRKAQKNDC